VITDSRPDAYQLVAAAFTDALYVDQDARAEVAAARPIPYIRTGAELDAFLLETFGIVLPARAICKHHRAPRDAFHDAYFARYPVTVWKGSRGLGGKTFMLSLLALVESLTLRANVNVLGGSGDQSARVLEYHRKFWATASAQQYRDLLLSEPGAIVNRFAWGNELKALTASTKAVRGPHPHRLRLDEVDEMAEKIWRAAMGQPMVADDILSQVVLSSTHHYADRTFTKVLDEAQEKGHPVYEWCYHETRQANGGWLSEEEIGRKRAMMTVLDWTTEVDMQEPSPEDRAFDLPSVERMFSRDPALGELEDPILGEGAPRYAHGADWARDVDRTVVATLRDAGAFWKLVALKITNREPWPTMIGYFVDRVLGYPGAAMHDRTGLGHVVEDYLTVEAEGFDMVGKARADLFGEYIHAVEHDEIRVPLVAGDADIDRLKRAHRFCTRKALYSSSGHPPDEIVAMALAYAATRKPWGGVGTLKQPDNAAPAPKVDHLAGLAGRSRPTEGVFGKRGAKPRAIALPAKRPEPPPDPEPDEPPPAPSPPVDIYAGRRRPPRRRT
jgi:hypothetical protein